MENFNHHCILAWVGKIASMPFSRNPSIFFNAWISTSRPIGRPSLTTRESFLKSLKYCNDHVGEDFETVTCPNGKHEKWIPMAQGDIDWKF